MKSGRRIFGPGELERVEAAIRDAEKRTAAELVVCVADRSGRYDRGAGLCGVLLGLSSVALAWISFQGFVEADWGPAPALGLVAILLLFLGGFLLGTTLATRLPPLASFFTQRAEMLAEVRQRAAGAFYRQGVHGTRQATGILIFISLLERMVWVVGDDAINEKIPQAQWDDMRDAIVLGFKDERAADGLCRAINKAGELLAEHVPGVRYDVDELDNSIRFVES